MSFAITALSLFFAVVGFAIDHEVIVFAIAGIVWLGFLIASAQDLRRSPATPSARTLFSFRAVASAIARRVAARRTSACAPTRGAFQRRPGRPRTDS